MWTKTATALFSIVLMSSAPQTQPRNYNRQVEEVTGYIVAYDQMKLEVSMFHPCHWCDQSIIVRVNKLDETPPRYIRVDFFTKQNKFPRHLVEGVKSNRQLRFRLIRTTDQDNLISEFYYFKDVYGEDKKSPIWELVRWAREEQLPFDQVIPSFSVAKDGIKLVSER